MINRQENVDKLLKVGMGWWIERGKISIWGKMVRSAYLFIFLPDFKTKVIN